MKHKLNQKEFDELNPALKSEYKQEGSDYILQVEGGEDVGALKRAKEHEKLARQEAEKKAKDLQSAFDVKQEELDNVRRGAIPKGDVDALENSWKTKLEAATTSAAQQLKQRDSIIEQVTITSTAQKLATEISTSPDLVIPGIKNRLKVELTDNGVVTRVLDVDGKPSAMTVTDLGNEFKTNPIYAAVIIGSKASGGGANGGSGGGSAAKLLKDMNDSERTDLFRNNPAEFKRLVAIQKNT